MLGGLGVEKSPDDTIASILVQVGEPLFQKLRPSRPHLDPFGPSLLPLAYKTQVVAGTNFFIKVTNTISN